MNCLDCSHAPDEHDSTADAMCLVCACDGLHIDVGDCVPACRRMP
jgi:hypothetical protein